ncbi:MAG: hypothetical protein WB609_00585 [Candidatus Cybelea sp.]
MAFNPLGNFNPTAPIDPGVLAKAKTLLASLPKVPAGSLSRLYLHWTVAPFGCTFGDYNGEADFEGGNWKMIVTHDPRDNAVGVNNNEPASHTWHRNTGAVGVSIAGMSGATENNFGPDSVTITGLEHLCACAGAFAQCYGIDSLGTVSQGASHLGDGGREINTAGEHTILTHAECASVDGYLCGFTTDPDCRWDLGSLVALPGGTRLTKEMVSQCGDALRQRVHAYKGSLGTP